MNLTLRQDLSEEEYEKLVEGIKETVENDHSIPIICLPESEKNTWDKSQRIRFKQLMSGELKHGTRLRKMAFKQDLSIIKDNFSMSICLGRRIIRPTYEDIEDAIRCKKVKWSITEVAGLNEEGME